MTLPLKLVIIAIFIAVAAVPSVYFYNQYQKAQESLKNPQKAVNEETKKIIEKVGKLIDLPKGEEPTVATITDKNKLKDQSFFSKAENGDKVLIFGKAQKAILYRPSTNKIIEVAPVNLGNTQVVKVALLNGTTTTGLTKTAETDLKEKVANVEIVLKENAEKQNYEKTIVVDLTGNNETVAASITSALSGEVGSLPSGETNPSGADILVILGSNYIK